MGVLGTIPAQTAKYLALVNWALMPLIVKIFHVAKLAWVSMSAHCYWSERTSHESERLPEFEWYHKETANKEF